MSGAARAFLVREKTDGERAAGCEVAIVQCLDDLEPGEDTEISVIATAGPHGIDM